MNVDDYYMGNTGSTRTRRGLAVSRPDPIIFNDAIKTAHVENSIKIVIRSKYIC